MKHLILIIPLVLTLNAFADTSIGVGTLSCGEWVSAAQKKKNNKNATLTYAMALSWIHGYVTAKSVELNNPALIDSVSMGSMELIVTNYCKKNPMSNIFDVSRILVLTLNKRRQQ